MGIRLIKDGQVVQETPKSPLELRLEELEARIYLLEKVNLDLTNQIKDLKKQNGKKVSQKTSTRGVR